MKHARRWRALSLAPLLILLTTCGTTVSDPVIVNVPLEQYSADFQNRLADEIEAAVREGAVPCDREEVTSGCSAWLRAMLDYRDLRKRVRAIEDLALHTRIEATDPVKF